MPEKAPRPRFDPCGARRIVGAAAGPDLAVSLPQIARNLTVADLAVEQADVPNQKGPAGIEERGPTPPPRRRCTLLRHLITLVLVVSAGPAVLGAQDAYPRREGDPTVVAGIDAQTRILYDSTEKWAFAFTRANLADEPGAYGTEIQAGLRGGVPVRIIAGGWTSRGRFGAEYYLVNRRLVFVYESSEHFRESAGSGWRNFKGNEGWERRIYLVEGRVAYVETTGEGATELSAQQLESRVTRILEALRR